MGHKPEKRPLELWMEFLGPESNPTHCGLCGNQGFVDTRGKVFTPAGVECGVLRYCICPNGRALKTQKAKIPR